MSLVKPYGDTLDDGAVDNLAWLSDPRRYNIAWMSILEEVHAAQRKFDSIY